MMQLLPITLTGDNLGTRHRQLNCIVKDAIADKNSFQAARDQPEYTPVDRIFKIDLASKLRCVEYILDNLRDEDMLYVSRALKCTWLLECEHEHIINPLYLETQLYPNMYTTAVSKMKNWLYLHLKDSRRCQVFYEYYKDTQFNYAVKFLKNCDSKYIMSVVEKIPEKLSPQQFKVLCEKCPQVAEIYFEIMPESDELKNRFLDEELSFYESLKVVLKQDPDIYFNIAERYFEKKYNSRMTKHIMKEHRDRFNRKPELYAVVLLDLHTLAQCLSAQECEELVLKLARAEYLAYRFNYKNMEPLMKRIKPDQRAAFKKRVFVDKDVGEKVKEWQYKIPVLPKREHQNIESYVFGDKTHMPYCDTDLTMLRCGMAKRAMFCSMKGEPCFHIETMLDKLFDTYRYVGFGKTMYEIRKRLKTETSLENRRSLLLVLVSKTGGRTEFVESLLELLTQHANEPANLRAAVVRSLVNRAAVWRLPHSSWQMMVQFAQGLGLDGTPSELVCHEGLHAAVIRRLLEGDSCEPQLRDAFLNCFSNLHDYRLNANEKIIIADRLPMLLLTAAEEASVTKDRSSRLSLLLDTLQAYKVPLNTSILIPAVLRLAVIDSDAAEPLLKRLYQAKAARSVLFRHNFPLVQTDASYLNALRHDVSVIKVEKFIDLVCQGAVRFEKFSRKLSVYFKEEGGLMEMFLAALKAKVSSSKTDDLKTSLARTLCQFQGAEAFLSSARDCDKPIGILSANMHLGRPRIDVSHMEPNVVGVKAIANRALSCPASKAPEIVDKLLSSRNTVIVAIILAERLGKESDAFAVACRRRPTAVLKAALKYFRRKGDAFDFRVWETVRPLLGAIDYTKSENKYLRNYICKIDYIPSKIKGVYCTDLVGSYMKHKELCNEATLMLFNIENQLPLEEETFIEHTLVTYFNKLEPKNYKHQDNDRINLHIRILVKHCLFAKNYEVQTKRLELLLYPLLGYFEALLSIQEAAPQFNNIFEEFLNALKYNKVIFNKDYVSPLSMLEVVARWMNTKIPIEQNFGHFISLKLTMLYYKAVTQSMKEKAEIFNDEKRKGSEGVDLVGITLGRLIAQEAKELSARYSDSILQLYRKQLTKYMTEYIPYSTSGHKFLLAMTKGIIEGSKGGVGIIATRLVQKGEYYFAPETAKLVDQLRNIDDIETKFFAYAEL